MALRTFLSGMAVATLMTAGCSSAAPPPAAGDSPTTTATPTATSAVTTPTLPAVLTNLGLGLDVDLAWIGLCTAWRFDDHLHEATINEAIGSLFANNPDNSSNFSPEQLDEAVRIGCAEPTTQEGLAAGLESLTLAAPDMQPFIDDACQRYVRAVRGVPGGQQFDSIVSGVLGLDHEELTQVVIDVCGAELFDSYVEPIPPSILPSEATPGELDAAFDPAEACTTDPPVPPIDAALAAEVLAVYELDAAEHEVVRLIPFELGGATTAANLFPIAIDAHPGAADKHGVDELVIDLYCRGEVTLQEAGVALIINWPVAFPTLNNL